MIVMEFTIVSRGTNHERSDSYNSKVEANKARRNLAKEVIRHGTREWQPRRRRRKKKIHARKDEWKRYKRLKTKVKVGFQNI